MMTNREIRQIAMEQSARDLNARPEDFLRPEHVVVPAKLGPEARKYYKEPIACSLVSYGGNIVASAQDDCRAVVEEYIAKFPWYHCFETPNLRWLDDRLRPMGQGVCFMAEYFLPDVSRLTALPCSLPLRLLGPDDFGPLYVPKWSNALCEERRELDVLGVGAWDGDEPVGFAACSADCDTMCQIGVDVLPAYRRRGLASALTSRLALEILDRGRVPFYCCAWSNIPSARNAIRSGFVPAWAEMSAKPLSFIAEMNR